MNKQKFIELLREPSSISKDELSGLENVTRQYPYFQSAHLLLAKGSRIRKDPNTKKRISSAAVYCTDRTLLKRYISGDMIFLDSVKKPPINVNEELPEKKAKKLVKPATKKAVPVKSEHTKSETPQIAEPDMTQDATFNPDSILDEIKGGLASYKANKKHFEEYLKEDEEDKAVNEAILKAEIAKPEVETEVTAEKESLPETATDHTAVDDIDDEIPSVTESPVEIEDIDDDSESTEDEIEFDISGIIEEIKNDEAVARESEKAKENEINQPPANEVESSEPDIKKVSETEKSLDQVADSAPEDEPKKSNYSSKIVISGSNKSKNTDDESPVMDDKASVEPTIDQNKDVESSTEEISSSESATDEVNPATGLLVSRDDPKANSDDNLSPGELRKAKMKRLKMQKEIIDDFIDTTPQMPKPSRKPKPVEEKTEDLSAPSQVAKTEIVSENMAIIYKNQGKLDKAVEIYNKLILKFPEKEAYFVTRIKELK